MSLEQRLTFINNRIEALLRCKVALLEEYIQFEKVCKSTKKDILEGRDLQNTLLDLEKRAETFEELLRNTNSELKSFTTELQKMEEVVNDPSV